MRNLVAVLIGKALMALLRRLGLGGGTQLPGRVALKVAPTLDRALSRPIPRGTVLITGTNGKTTTGRLLASILRAAGITYVRNSSGANLRSGIASALIEAADLRGRVRRDVAVFEADEAAAVDLIPLLEPTIVAVTNFFRDQLDRYGELDRTARRIGDSIRSHLAPASTLILNADDPRVCSLAQSCPGAVRFLGIHRSPAGEPPGQVGASAPGRSRGVRAGARQGVAPLGQWALPRQVGLPECARERAICPPGSGTAGLPAGGPDLRQWGAADSGDCEICGRPFIYHARYFAHLGDWECPICGAHRPPLGTACVQVEADGPGQRLRIVRGDETEDVVLPLPGLYNAYNLLVAVAAARELGIGWHAIQQGLAAVSPAFGRAEWVPFENDRKALLLLVKNPTGFNEVVRSVVRPGPLRHTVIALNDRIADGRDVSWIWDTEMEELPGAVASVIASGLRAEDMALRLKYAGFDTESIHVIKDTRVALSEALRRAAPGEGVLVLATYTAMLGLRRRLQREGRVGKFWEE